MLKTWPSVIVVLFLVFLAPVVIALLDQRNPGALELSSVVFSPNYKNVVLWQLRARVYLQTKTRHSISILWKSFGQFFGEFRDT